MNEKINMQTLIDCLVERQGLGKKETGNFVKEFFRLIEEALEREKYVKIKGLGTFKLISVDSRESININTGERFEIHGHTKISFSPDPILKDYINKPFAHFDTVVLHENTVFADDVQIDSQEKENSLVEQTLDKIEKNVTDVEEAHLDEHFSEQEKQTEMMEQQNSSEHENSISSSFVKRNWSVVVLFILFLGIACFYWGDNLNTNNHELDFTQDDIDTQVDLGSGLVADTFEMQKKDTVKDVVKIIGTSDIILKVSSNKYFVPDSTTYLIIGTDTVHVVQEGETLTKIALKYYGTKALWPYLVMHNSTVIKTPNYVPFGTKIQIPKLKKK